MPLSRPRDLRSRVAASMLNRLLATDEQARSLLKAHAGQTAVLALPPVDVSLSVTADGRLEMADPAAAPDLRIRVTPASAILMLSGNATTAGIASVEGDGTFAATVRQLAGRLRWDAEEGMSRVVGDIAAHRIATGARGINTWRREAAGRMLQGAAEYVTEETRVLPPRAEVEAWIDDVDRIRDAVERFEKRLARLESHDRAGRR